MSKQIKRNIKTSPKKKLTFLGGEKIEEKKEKKTYASYNLSLVKPCIPSFPAAIDSEMATITNGKPIRKCQTNQGDSKLKLN